MLVAVIREETDIIALSMCHVCRSLLSDTRPECKEAQHGASIFGTFEVGVECSGIRAVWGLLPGACKPVTSYRTLV